MECLRFNYQLKLWVRALSRMPTSAQTKAVTRVPAFVGRHASSNTCSMASHGCAPLTPGLARHSAHCRPNMTTTRSYVTASTSRRLARLEQEANLHPEDITAQANLARELNRANRSDLVVKRFESGRFAAGEAMNREYLKALVASGKVDSVNMGAATGAAGAANAALPGLSSVGALGAAGINEHSPLHVTMVPESTGAWLRRFGRTLLLFGVVFYVAREYMGVGKPGSGVGINPMSAMTKRAEPVLETGVRFTDVMGVDDAKSELEEVVAYLRDPSQFTRLGGKLPKGVLLMGPPGTGKTLLARAVAGEAEVPFYYASGSEFEEMFVGVGARRVRDLFTAAKEHSPCLIFLDEIDAIGSTRNPRDQQAIKMTLNQLLVELDGFAPNTGVIVIAATNFPQALDKALVRPGRFDRKVRVGLPDIAGRRDILQLYITKIQAASDIDVDSIARDTPGFTGADLSNLVNSAALLAATQHAEAVTMAHIEEAKDKIIMGAARKLVMSPSEVENTAYHEAGHALVALLTPDAAPVRKATIMPRGHALGMVSLVNTSEISRTRAQLLAQIDVCMGGRIGEELKHGKDNVTTGAGSDFDSASRIARAMVTEYGMSASLGVTTYKPPPGERRLEVSASTRDAIDGEVQAILQSSYKRVHALMSKHKKAWRRIAQGLLEYETLSGAEVEALMKGKKITRSSPPPPPPPAAVAATVATSG